MRQLELNLVGGSGSPILQTQLELDLVGGLFNNGQLTLFECHNLRPPT
jgi:hypothetical protein